MNKNELFSQVSKLLNEYIESNIPEPKVIEKPVEKIVEKPAELPNDKIILSAETFSKIINVISYAENQNIIEPVLSDIYDDVKRNRINLSKSFKNEYEKETEKLRKHLKDIKKKGQEPTLFDILEWVTNPYGKAR